MRNRIKAAMVKTLAQKAEHISKTVISRPTIGSNMGAQNSYGGNSGMTGEPYQQSGYSPYYQGSDRDGQNAEQYQNEQYDPQNDRGLDEDQRQTFSSDAFYDSGSEHDKQTDYSSHVVDINAPRDGEER